MYNKNEKKSENWKNWIAIFTVGLLLILVYKLRTIYNLFFKNKYTPRFW